METPITSPVMSVNRTASTDVNRICRASTLRTGSLQVDGLNIRRSTAALKPAWKSRCLAWPIKVVPMEERRFMPLAL